MKYVPNILSFIRLALSPLFVYAFFNSSPLNAFWVFLIASALDIIDGFIARKFNAISNLGKILDPVADKVLQLSAVICFTVKEIIPLFVIIVLGLKELTMLIGGGIISKKKKNMVYSNVFGKIASFITSVTLCAMFFTWEGGFLADYKSIVDIVLYIAVGLSVISMVQYGIIALFIKKDPVETVEKEA